VTHCRGHAGWLQRQFLDNMEYSTKELSESDLPRNMDMNGCR